MSSPLRSLRENAGLSQAELAIRAGVSRQLVGAAESGRHLPRVDAALALAAVLGVDVGEIFSPGSEPVDIVTGATPRRGESVRVGRVGVRVVTAPMRSGRDGWDVVDGTVGDGSVDCYANTAPGIVVAGCEPGLELLERLLREKGSRAVAATASSEAALSSLREGRVHAAVVHGEGIGNLGEGLVQFQLATWRVGIAAPTSPKPDWASRAISGQVPVVQREVGAGVQKAFIDAAGRIEIPGPRVWSHLAAVEAGKQLGLPSVTIEPAALATGVDFHPLQTHFAQLVVDRRWIDEGLVVHALATLCSAGFTRRLAAIGGYDLEGIGTRVG